LSVRVALQVSVAWLKQAPSDALAEAARRLWAAAAAAASAAPPPCAALTAQAAAAQGSSSAMAAWRWASRCALRESLYDVLDWRVASSRPDAATTDSLGCYAGAEHDDVGATGAAADAADVSWAGAGGEASFAAAWAVSLCVKRVAWSVLVDLAVDDAAASASAAAAAALAAQSPDGTSDGISAGPAAASRAPACDVGLAASDAGDGCSSDSSSSDGSSSDGSSSDGSSAAAWGYGSSGAALVARLQAGAVAGELGERRACVHGLARLALAWPDPARFALYAFLHQLQAAAADHHAHGAAAHGAAQEGVAQGASGGASGGAEGLGVGDLLAPALLLLDCEYAAKDAELYGASEE
jgi:hypothetical protein